MHARGLNADEYTTTKDNTVSSNCNGLVEKFNGMLKTMLRRLCSEQPRQWHRYVNPLLFFAYRGAPGVNRFSAFELVYGRTVGDE